jgi:Clp amino terminal domain, pathogenicity island component
LPAHLRAVAALRGLVEVLEALQVDNARANGWSWQDIASRMGVSKQPSTRSTAPQPLEAREVAMVVRFTEPAGIVPHLGREGAERRRQHDVGPEHLLVGLLRQGDNAAATLLGDHGLDLATVQAGIDQLVDQGVLPGPS